MLERELFQSAFRTILTAFQRNEFLRWTTVRMHVDVDSVTFAKVRRALLEQKMVASFGDDPDLAAITAHGKVHAGSYCHD